MLRGGQRLGCPRKTRRKRPDGHSQLRVCPETRPKRERTKEWGGSATTVPPRKQQTCCGHGLTGLATQASCKKRANAPLTTEARVSEISCWFQKTPATMPVCGVVAAILRKSIPETSILNHAGSFRVWSPLASAGRDSAFVGSSGHRRQSTALGPDSRCPLHTANCEAQRLTAAAETGAPRPGGPPQASGTESQCRSQIASACTRP